MIKRKRLGQHLLNSNRIAKTIVSAAEISNNDTVYEIGTGNGILTRLLYHNAKKVTSVDADRRFFENAKSSFMHIGNLTLQFGDGFKKNNNFTIFVSNLPYSKSRHAIEWLAQTSFSHGVIMVQQEFAQKLLPKSKSERKAVSVIANYAFDITKISNVGSENFNPPPQVDSVLLKIRQKRTVEKTLIQTINKVFSYRKKKVQNIFKQFGKELSLIHI